ncbi:MAG: hypothetical protein WDO73_03780 [Ignavibacteriota bacterium]
MSSRDCGGNPTYNIQQAAVSTAAAIVVRLLAAKAEDPGLSLPGRSRAAPKAHRPTGKVASTPRAPRAPGLKVGPELSWPFQLSGPASAIPGASSPAATRYTESREEPPSDRDLPARQFVLRRPPGDLRYRQGNDIDDALALAMLHSLTDRGECELIGVTLTTPIRPPYRTFAW